MNRWLCFCLWMLLSLSMADGTKCYACDRILNWQECKEPLPACELQKGESCYRETLFGGGLTHIENAGCLQNCQIYPNMKCCSDFDFCNQ